VAESRRLVDGIVRLRRAERIPAASADVAPVRRDLERALAGVIELARGSAR